MDPTFPVIERSYTALENYGGQTSPTIHWRSLSVSPLCARAAKADVVAMQLDSAMGCSGKLRPTVIYNRFLSSVSPQVEMQSCPRGPDQGNAGRTNQGHPKPLRQ